MSESVKEILARIDERTKQMKETVDSQHKEMVERINSHGRRIATLEKWKWGLSGAITLVAGIFGISKH